MHRSCLCGLILAFASPTASQTLRTVDTYDSLAAQNSANLRIVLLANYDSTVPPPGMGMRNIRNSSLGSETGTDVELEIRFMKVFKVDVAAGSMSVKVWFRMGWNDTRLAWDPNTYNGVEYVYFAGDYWGERSEIWIPDIQLMNSVSSTTFSLEPSMAMATSSGNVFFSRPGTLELMCRFSGLVAFPFDDLKCSFEVGGWMLSNFHQQLILKAVANMDPSTGDVTYAEGYSLDGIGGGGQEKTRGASYQEYAVKSVDSRLVTYVYGSNVAGQPDEPYSVGIFTLTLDRNAKQGFYGLYYIFPSIFLTLLSFTVFWADTSSADALGFGITVIVVVMLLNIVLVGMVPVCGELLWLDLFSMVNVGFCCLSLLQSAVIIALESYEDDHLLPIWLLTFLSKSLKKLIPNSKAAARIGPRAGLNPEQLDQLAQEDAATGVRNLASSAHVLESIAGVLFRQMKLTRPSRTSTQSMGSASSTEALSDADIERLVYFERMFLDLDEDSDGYLTADMIYGMLSFCSLEMDQGKRRKMFEQADLHKDESLTRLEFCLLCRDAIWDVPISRLQLAMQNLKDIKHAKVTRNQKYWKETAKFLEHLARYYVIPMYITALVLLFVINFEDDYDIPADNEVFDPSMKEGFGTAYFTGDWPLIFVPLCVFGALFLMQYLSKAAEKRLLREQKTKENEAVGAILVKTSQTNILAPSAKPGDPQ